MRNRYLAIVVVGLFMLPARATVAQETGENMGGAYANGGFVVGPSGMASPVIGDGVGGGFVVGPSGVASPVLGDDVGGRFVVGPRGIASPVIGDGN
jgi:hypothetical protein